MVPGESSIPILAFGGHRVPSGAWRGYGTQQCADYFGLLRGDWGGPAGRRGYAAVESRLRQK